MCKTKTECYLVITKNNEVIWPVRGEGETAVDLEKQATWAVSGATEDFSIAELSVTAGDDIRFMMARTTNTGSNPVGMWPTITYTSEVTSESEKMDDIVLNVGDLNLDPITTNFEDNKPTLDTTNETVTFNGNWSLMYFASLADVAGDRGITCDTFSNVDTVRTNLSIPYYTNSNYSAVKGAFYTGTRSELSSGVSNSYAAMACSGSAVSYRYTSPYAGTVDIDFTKLGRFSKQSSTNAVISFAIYVDGVKVWPVTAAAEGNTVNANGWYGMTVVASASTDILDAANAFDQEARRNIPVKAGSHVDILMCASDKS